MAAPSAILPEKGKRNILITSALPYVNNVPHLGNIIGCVLSADVYARYCKQKGYNTLYICGTDEYGTATETKAMSEGTTPQEICDRYHKIHAQVYDWFQIGFDHFGRTTTPQQTQISQDIFRDVLANDYLIEEESQQLFCEKDDRFLADRLVEGECPFCHYNDARGDQCDGCGKLLNPTELIKPRCQSCNSTPVIRNTKHLYLDLTKITPQLTEWVDAREKSGEWSSNAVATTRTWLRDGLKPRCITRDLKWGTPVPHPGYESKVFYVWFDAPIGYISITATYTPDWKQWWLTPENNVELVQFMGKDNTPFHTVVFPSSLLASKQPWTMLHAISTTEYLTYEQGKFSKSRNRGIFGDAVQATGLNPDIWRYYLMSVRPEGADTDFSWEELRIKINADLADNLGNFVNRGLKFVASNFDSKVPQKSGDLLEVDTKLIADVNAEMKVFESLMEQRKLRDGLKSVMAIARLGNGYLQATKPWDLVKAENFTRCANVLILHCSLVRLLALYLRPFTPGLADRILAQLGLTGASVALPATFEWDAMPSGHTIGTPEPLVPRLGAPEIAALRARFTPEASADALEEFPLDLRVATITSVVNHPTSDTLYVLKVALGGEERQVVAGIRAHYTPEQLQDRQVIVVCNLGESKFRGELSQGMLLTVINAGKITLLSAPGATVGTLIKPDNHKIAAKPKFDGKKVKGLPFKYTAKGIIYNKDFALKAGESPVVVSEEGQWEGGIVQ
jgi:methionyl-tRNA synthetase